jgi:tetratricopeptide (TPR) repeat protein
MSGSNRGLKVKAPMLHQAHLLDVDAVLRAGVKALETGRHADALPATEAALKVHPRNLGLLHLAGLLHSGVENPGAALKAFRKASALAPEDGPIAAAHAIAANDAGMPALPLFERARRLAPDDGPLLLAQASALLSEGRVDEALEAVERRLDQSPGWREGHICAARLRWVRGERETFTASLEKAERAAPRDLNLWCLHLETLFGASRSEAVLELLPRARAAAGANRVFDEAEAMAVADLGRTEEADRLFANLSQSRNISLILHYVRHLLRSGRVEEVVRRGDAALADKPHPLLWPYLSLAWRLTGDPRWEWLEGDPSFTGIYDLGVKLPRLDALARSLRARHTTRNEPLHQSVRGGTQSEGNLFSMLDPEIRALRLAILEAVEEHVPRLPPHRPGHPLLLEKRGPIRFAGSWSVRLTGGGHHANHNHPAGWLSSAFYVALPKPGEGDSADAGHLVLGEFNEIGIDLPPLRVVEPRPGRLVLFPSTMWHSTRPFGAGERLTVAFDVAPPK